MKLEWKQIRSGNSNRYRAYTPFGSYATYPSSLGWFWSHCFNEFCDGPEEAKAAAEAHWQERIAPIVERVQASDDDKRLDLLQHEALHACHIVQETFDQHVANSQYVLDDEDLTQLAEKAHAALYEVYNAIASKDGKNV